MRDTPGHHVLSPDAEAVRRAQAGDEQGFSSLVRRHSGAIYTLALRTLGNTSDAEDAVQEIFLKAYRALPRFDPDRRFFPWLYTIAVNHLRSLTRRRRSGANDNTLPVSEELLPGATSEEPEAQLLASEARSAVERALRAVSPVQRRVFLLRQVQGLSTRETAHLLGIPANTVKTHLRRARAVMERVLVEDETTNDSRAYMESGADDELQ